VQSTRRPPAGEDVNPYRREGYAPCKGAAERAALDSGLPVTVIRPSKIHGPYRPVGNCLDLLADEVEWGQARSNTTCSPLRLWHPK
jgi:nucleoside-diphosphate-sugar epimerase